jgi:hypothetical protein
MDLPQEVLIYSQILGLSGTQGTLVAVRPEGYFELRLTSKGRLHQVYLPVAQTGIVFAEPEAEIPSDLDIER